MALVITVNIPDEAEAYLKNDLLDVEDWVQKAVEGKVNQCRKRMIREWQPRLFSDPEVMTIPAEEKAFLALVLARSDYKDRATREADKVG